MNNIIDVINDTLNRDEQNCERVMRYFEPLKKLFVTKYVERKREQVFSFFTYSHFKTYNVNKYFPLNIVVHSNFDKVRVDIICTQYDDGDLAPTIVSKTFLSKIFDKNDYAISHEDSVRDFIKCLLPVAHPIWLKYECLVNHIKDETKRNLVSSKLHEYFKSKEYQSLEIDAIHETVINKIKEWEK